MSDNQKVIDQRVDNLERAVVALVKILRRGGVGPSDAIALDILEDRMTAEKE